MKKPFGWILKGVGTVYACSSGAYSETDQYNEMTHIEVCSVEGLFTRRLLDEESADEVPRASLTNCLG